MNLKSSNFTLYMLFRFGPLNLWLPELFNRMSDGAASATLCEMIREAVPQPNSTLVLLEQSMAVAGNEGGIFPFELLAYDVNNTR